VPSVVEGVIMPKPLKIAIASPKGGVGKTTIAVNLAVALSLAGYKILLFESDNVNSGISYHLGKIDEESALHVYKPTGLYYMPASVSESASKGDMRSLLESTLNRNAYDMVIVDTPSTNKDVFSWKFDSGLVIVNPDEQSCASGIMAKDMIESSGAKCNIILNRGFEKPYALNVSEIEEMFGYPLLAYIEEDVELRKSLLEHVPNFLSENAPKFNAQVEKIAKVYAAMIDEDYAQKFSNIKDALKKAKSEIKKHTYKS
jgi:MinD-like ATPase involved in chromosome partitioning or flagellar assembly